MSRVLDSVGETESAAGSISADVECEMGAGSGGSDEKLLASDLIDLGEGGGEGGGESEMSITSRKAENADILGV